MAPSDLGKMLVAEGVLSRSELERLDESRRPRRQPLWSALLEASAASEDEIYYALAQRSGGALADEMVLATVEPLDGALRATLSARDARQAGVLPLSLSDDGCLTVVMIDPTDEETLDALARRAKALETRALLARRTALLAAVARAFAEPEPLDTGASPPTPAPDNVTATPGADDALLARALMQSLEVVARELELRLPTAAGDDSGVGRAAETARLCRRVARELGLARRTVDEIGIAGLLAALDRRLAFEDQFTKEGAKDRFAALGWAALAEGGLGATLRTLAAAQGKHPTAPLSAQIVGAVIEVLDLGSVAALADLDAVSQLLRAGHPGRAAVVDALLRVLDSDGARNIDTTAKTARPEE
jgi:hypothetical protein